MSDEMIDQLALLTALKARLTELALAGSPEIASFKGDDRSLNPDAVFPHVAVNVGNCDFSDHMEVGPVTIEATDHIEIIVSTADKRAAKGQPAVTGQYEAGLGLLAAIRIGLNGYEITSSCYLVLVNHVQDLGFAGIFEWTMRFDLKQLDSRAKPA